MYAQCFDVGLEMGRASDPIKVLLQQFVKFTFGNMSAAIIAAAVTDTGRRNLLQLRPSIPSLKVVCTAATYH